MAGAVARVAGAVDAGVVLGVWLLSIGFTGLGGWMGGWVTLMGLMHSDGAAGVGYFGWIQDHRGPLVYVTHSLDFTSLYAVALGILYTHFSLQLAIPTIPSSPTTSLHSSHQDLTRSKATISAIHTGAI